MIRTHLIDRVTGSILVLGGAVAGVEASTFDVAFLTDPVGPKALPGVVACILVGVGLRMLVRPRDVVELPDPEVAGRLGAAVLAFLTYTAALSWLGFFTSTTLVIVALARLYRGPLVPSVTAALAISGALWLLFVAALSLPLPVGDLWIR